MDMNEGGAMGFVGVSIRGFIPPACLLSAFSKNLLQSFRDKAFSAPLWFGA